MWAAIRMCRCWAVARPEASKEARTRSAGMVVVTVATAMATAMVTAAGLVRRSRGLRSRNRSAELSPAGSSR